MRYMSQSDLAAKLGMGSMTGGTQVSHWECGRRTPHVKHLRAICIALNVSADYLLDSHDTKLP
jgi:transcriptional regulator with XRE-family HTH domain